MQVNILIITFNIFYQCEKVGELSPFYHPESQTCHEYFTKGPCQRSGELFLPSKKCGCHQKIPHYYNQTNQCYEIKSQGNFKIIQKKYYFICI